LKCHNDSRNQGRQQSNENIFKDFSVARVVPVFWRHKPEFELLNLFFVTGLLLTNGWRLTNTVPSATAPYVLSMASLTGEESQCHRLFETNIKLANVAFEQEHCFWAKIHRRAEPPTSSRTK
jgi:hypothetical protein